MKHADDTATKSNEKATIMQESAPHPEGVKYPPHLLICKACAEFVKSIDTAAKRKPRTIRAFVKVRGKDEYVRNPRLLELAKRGMFDEVELESL
ncbi:MAG TPA: hypothetical protein VE957_06350 [Terriglobales bacterium]|nr:hypothetical protein [Terriglobales bacterium]